MQKNVCIKNGTHIAMTITFLTASVQTFDDENYNGDGSIVFYEFY